MRQDGPAGVSTGRRSTRGVHDVAVLVDEHEIAASTHHFYNEQETVVLAGGVALFAVQLEHPLEPWLADRADVSVAQMLAGDQAERGVALESARGQIADALDAAVFEVSRKQHVGAASTGREDFDRQAQLVRKHQLLHPSLGEQRPELVAHRRQRQRVEAHTAA
jgi:hypothetical protein